MKLEQDIALLNQEYSTSLDQITQETERVLSDNEAKELKSRLAILSSEIREKSSMIDQTSTEKNDLDRELDRLQKLEAQSLAG
jgi:hypothetical protein